MRTQFKSQRITVVRVAGERELTDAEVFDTLERQMARGTLEISVKATSEQVDKAMRVLMGRVAERDIARIEKTFRRNA